MRTIRSHRLKNFIRFGMDFPLFCIGLFLIPLNLILYKFADWFGFRPHKSPRLLFGVTPIISLAYISRALRQKGYHSDVVVIGESSIYSQDTFDKVLLPNKKMPKLFKLFFGNCLAYKFFLTSIWKYDVFHYYFDGGLLRNTLFARAELILLRMCGKKIVLLPYGSDAFVYDLIPNPLWRHALMLEYSQFGNEAARLQKKIRRMTAKADIVIACLVHFINLPRWDILPLTCYPIDTQKLQPVYPNTRENPIRIAHACNHRGVKGTVFLVSAVARLKDAGFKIELDIIEKVSNTEALQRIQACDIYVDQLMFGYAQAALEALSLGKVVISALGNNPAYDLFRRFSYLNECPIVPADSESIYEVLLALIKHRDRWKAIGEKSRRFAETRHSFKACAEMYTAIYDKIWWKKPETDLINFYHPLKNLLSATPKTPPIEHHVGWDLSQQSLDMEKE
jgi:glycosyltransferase involved in cell wall biosynthesis